MSFRTFAACLSTYQARDRQDLGSSALEVVSAQPTAQQGMVIRPPLAEWIKRDSMSDADRLRGGALACACCGGGGDSAKSPPLDPLAGVPREKQASQVVRAEPNIAPRQQMSQSTLPAGSSSKVQVDKVQSATKLLAPPGRAETGRTHSSPSAPQTFASPSEQQTRGRYQTLPSKFTNAHQTSAPSSSFSPISEDPDHDANPAFPRSVHVAGGSRKPLRGPPSVKAPFMQN